MYEEDNFDSVSETTSNLETNEKTLPKKKRKFLKAILFIIALGVAAIFTYFYLSTAPRNFPLNSPVTIESGTGMREAIRIVKNQGLVKSELALYAELMIKHPGKHIIASTYVFSEPASLSEVAARLTEGDLDNNLLRFVFVEGETVEQVSERAEESLENFDKEKFLSLALPFEGRLFPETYLIPRTYSAEELFNLLHETFNEKIDGIQVKIESHPLTLEEIIILASILEREANSKESKRVVSGILQQRLEIGMALQVDATMEYILNKPLAELTAEDLKTKSPYNTYLNPGLPPTAIANPGLESIEAVLNPEPTPYLFYITGKDGHFYYAEDFDAHRRNIELYLR